jgi:hypothetical protein
MPSMDEAFSPRHDEPLVHGDQTMQLLKVMSASVALALIAGSAGTAAAAAFDAKSEHAKFVDAFNNRQWDAVKSMLAAKSVFHRADGDQVYIGPDAIVGRFEKTIGAPDQWNVKFVRLDPKDQFTGKDGRVVNRASSRSPRAPTTAPATPARSSRPGRPTAATGSCSGWPGRIWRPTFRPANSRA